MSGGQASAACDVGGIKNAPEFVPETGRDDEAYRDRLGGYYGDL
jgi:hypothetical protein